MASTPNPDDYPDELNPFGSDDDNGEPIKQNTIAVQVQGRRPNAAVIDDYPDHLNPFQEFASDEFQAPTDLKNGSKVTENSLLFSINEYDDSLNPFASEHSEEMENSQTTLNSQDSTQRTNNESYQNPFEGDEEVHDNQTSSLTNEASDESHNLSSPGTTPQSLPVILDKPPVPLPRTKNLLKKEQLKKKEETSLPPNPPKIIQDNVPRKKRIAPPIPIDFKRPVPGSAEEYEKELKQISGELTRIDEDKAALETILMANEQPEVDRNKLTDEYIELIKRQEAVVERQKEMMYKRKEYTLNQYLSDLEYEIRMIRNKQKSSRTPEELSKEEELLKKMMEYVDEKNDIVENLSKVYNGENNFVEEALKKLNLSEHVKSINKKNVADTLDIPEICDNKNKHSSHKLRKFATLLPRGSTLKRPLKLKKHSFKKKDARSIEG